MAASSWLLLAALAVTVGSDISPTSVPIVGGSLITLRGSGFTDDSAWVNFTVLGVTEVAQATFVNDTVFRVRIPKIDVSECGVPISTIPVGVTDSYAAEVTLFYDQLPATYDFEGLNVTIRRPLKIMYLYVGPITDLGWTYNWNSYRLLTALRYEPYAELGYAANLGSVADVMDTRAAIIPFCEMNYDAVVATSFVFMDGMFAASNETVCNYRTESVTANGTTHFDTSEHKAPTYMLHASGSMRSPTMSTFMTKIYQLRYVSGVLTGQRMLETGDNVAGYLAPSAIPEVVRAVNAYALGCRSVNPDCTVKFLLINAFSDQWIEFAGAMKLWVEDHARVLAQHSDSTRGQVVFNAGGPPTCADLDDMFLQTTCQSPEEVLANAAYGTEGAGIGYNTDMQRLVGDGVMTSITITWDKPVEYFIDKIFADEWEPFEDFFCGSDVDSTINALADFSPLVSAEARLLTEAAYEKIRAGVDDVFCGSLKLSNGSAVPLDQYVRFDGSTPQGEFCDAADVASELCCISESPGLVDMYYLLEGVEWAAPADTKWGTTTAPAGGVLVPLLDEQGVGFLAPRENDIVCPEGYYKIWLSPLTVTCEVKGEKPNQQRHNIDPAQKSFMITLVVVNFVFVVICVFWTFYYRARVIVSLSRPAYMYTLCVGTVVTTLSSITPLYEKSTLSCQLMLWLYGAGFVITTATLYLKMQQMHAVIEHSLSFSKTPDAKLYTKRFEVILSYSLMALGETLILGTWYLYSPLVYKRSCVETQDAGFYEGVCIESVGKCRTTHGRLFMSLIGTYHVFLICIGMFMCYKVRNLPSLMAEGKWIFTGFYSQLQVFITAVPVLVVVNDNYETFTLLKSLVICVGDLTTLAMIYIPKMLLVYQYYDFDKNAITNFVLKSLTSSTQHDTIYETLRVKVPMRQTIVVKPSSSEKNPLHLGAAETFKRFQGYWYDSDLRNLEKKQQQHS